VFANVSRWYCCERFYDEDILVSNGNGIKQHRNRVLNGAA
jgi:hypothetical protein